jgi:decaprenylphospho-beta-D-ribofuranose 2-oxidase
MQISGWGRYSFVKAEIKKVKNLIEIEKLIKKNKKVIARGLGRSYGDSANNDFIVDTTQLNKILEFDSVNGIICCQSGVSIKEINQLTVNQGWFMPVTPGSSYVTIGGAIASDVHGKNHHLEGTLSQHLLSLELMLSDGEIINLSNDSNRDLFNATCGGMGLTGIIISASIKLKSICSTLVQNTVIKTRSLEETCEQFEKNFSSPYSVAWVDCLARGKNLGRSLLLLGKHLQEGNLKYQIKSQKYIPTKLFSFFLNKNTIRIFNNIYYYKNLKKINKKKLSLEDYFYPLDELMNWNLIYGKKGFIQYQFVVPKKNGIKVLKEILNIISEYNQLPFLGVLKKFGDKNENYLSFPMEGYTLALDFKVNFNLLSLISALDKKVTNYGGKIYLTKDTLMTEKTFKACYPEWEVFQNVRAKYKVLEKFSSFQSRRLGLE